MQDLLSIKAEFLLLIEGTIQTTGLPVHARTSYTPDEICFNYRFQNITTRLDNGLCRVDWSNFDTIELVCWREFEGGGGGVWAVMHCPPMQTPSSA